MPHGRTQTIHNRGVTVSQQPDPSTFNLPEEINQATAVAAFKLLLQLGMPVDELSQLMRLAGSTTQVEQVQFNVIEGHKLTDDRREKIQQAQSSVESINTDPTVTTWYQKMEAYQQQLLALDPELAVYQFLYMLAREHSPNAA